MAQSLATSVAEAPADAYTQRGVTAEATAENAVIARTRALAQAQRTAYERMAESLGLPRGLSDSQIDSMVSSIIVEEERSTRTGYSGRLTVNFNPNRAGGPGRASAHAGGSGSASGGGSGSLASSGGGAAGDAAPPLVPPALSLPAAGYIEAQTRFSGLREWLDLRQRLAANPEIASVDILAIAVDGARIRLGLRHTPELAMQALPAAGITLQPPVPTAAAPGGMPGLAPPVRYGAQPAAAPAGAGQATGPWQIGLAGRI
ncbi:hypothetical protein BKE38_12410 [Pseudoroseomonas deserti]|uniref:DUF2066 domain-containing protein n=1 Tax=Teichococcus deserti TaxID=1817963 RepID=A0A1V2H214_9PROT|nr:hypothetical protein [Pseudoroseomonas deserti]ONG53350.1 hypothetical protein BKE38_12410 [Pseudoroseomonas deserti]